MNGGVMSAISAYCSQVGCEMEEKDDLDEVVKRIPSEESVVIEADLNRHVGEVKEAVKERNKKGQVVLDFAKIIQIAV